MANVLKYLKIKSGVGVGGVLGEGDWSLQQIIWHESGTIFCRWAQYKARSIRLKGHCNRTMEADRKSALINMPIGPVPLPSMA